MIVLTFKLILLARSAFFSMSLIWYMLLIFTDSQHMTAGSSRALCG